MGMKPPARRPWADWERAELRRLAARPNASFESIAKRLGRTQAAIENQMTNMGIRLSSSSRPKMDPVENFFLNGEPLVFAQTGTPCARCGVREDVHRIHGCGQFAGEIRVRLK
jgi:hypothetical protein